MVFTCSLECGFYHECLQRPSVPVAPWLPSATTPAFLHEGGGKGSKWSGAEGPDRGLVHEDRARSATVERLSAPFGIATASPSSFTQRLADTSPKRPTSRPVRRHELEYALGRAFSHPFAHETMPPSIVGATRQPSKARQRRITVPSPEPAQSGCRRNRSSHGEPPARPVPEVKARPVHDTGDSGPVHGGSVFGA